ncbi:MAG: MFS transporter [candidate division Zixibacteria bacterium]|nr:MFS transporter [candidate division Zixibacteria bacterium]
MDFPGFHKRSSLFGWLIYDFANTIFSMNILTMYFAQWIVVDLGYPDIYYSVAYSSSMVAVALTLPILGHRSDSRGNKKGLLVLFTIGCIFATAFLGTMTLVISDVASLMIFGLICVGVANYFYEGGLVFYNAMLTSVSTKQNVGTISGLGVGLGYVGAICGLLLVQPFVDGAVPFWPAGRHAAFLPTAILFFLFFLPTWILLKEKPTVRKIAVERDGPIRGLVKSLKEAKEYRGAFRFLIADFLFEDAIATLIIFMAVYTEKVMGLPDKAKITLFIVSTLSAVVGSVMSGRTSDRFGHYATLKCVVIGWVMLLVFVSFTTDETLFWILGSVVGILLGSTWTISRPILNSLVPEQKLGLFYGLYSLSGKAAAVIGPVAWGAVVLLCKEGSPPAKWMLSLLGWIGVQVSQSVSQSIEYRFAVFSLAIIMLAGLIIYLRVPQFPDEQASPS